MAPTAPTTVAWTKEHDLELARAIIQNTLAVRSAIYHTPGLADVSGNGGDRINKKIQAILRAIPGGEAIVKEEVAKMSRNGGKRKEAEGRDESESPKKKATPTKRKAAAKKAAKKDSDEEEKGTESDQ